MAESPALSQHKFSLFVKGELPFTPVLQLPPEELTRLLLTLSCEELLERFGEQSNR
ncbi:hypothetical protein NDI49_30195 [Trichocoleus sp. ST-U3]